MTGHHRRGGRSSTPPMVGGYLSAGDDRPSQRGSASSHAHMFSLGCAVRWCSSAPWPAMRHRPTAPWNFRHFIPMASPRPVTALRPWPRLLHRQRPPASSSSRRQGHAGGAFLFPPITASSLVISMGGPGLLCGILACSANKAGIPAPAVHPQRGRSAAYSPSMSCPNHSLCHRAVSLGCAVHRLWNSACDDAHRTARHSPMRKPSSSAGK